MPTKVVSFCSKCRILYKGRPSPSAKTKKAGVKPENQKWRGHETAKADVFIGIFLIDNAAGRTGDNP